MLRKLITHRVGLAIRIISTTGVAVLTEYQRPALLKTFVLTMHMVQLGSNQEQEKLYC